MKKRFLLGMSLLLIASALQPSTFPSFQWDEYHEYSDDDDDVEEKYPLFHKFHRDLQKKYPDAGFDDSTLATRNVPSGNADTCHFAAETLYFEAPPHNIKEKIISTSPDELNEAERILHKMATNPSEVTSVETLYIAKYEGVLLHEAYHCNVPAKRRFSRLKAPNAKERFAMLTPILLGNTIAHMKSQFLKTRGLLPLSFLLSTSAALTVADKAITKTKAALDKYQEEIDADMHAAQHADGPALSNLIIAFKLKEIVHSPDITFNLLAQRESAHPILKPVFTSLINTTRTVHHHYLDQVHPVTSKRVQYLLKALQEKHPEYVDQVTTALKNIDTCAIAYLKAEYDEMLKKPSKHEELSYIQGLV